MNEVKEEAAQIERSVRAKVYIRGILVNGSFKEFPNYDLYIGRKVILIKDHVYDENSKFLGVLE